MNREDGFIGTGLRKDEFVADCSDIDEIIVFREDGKCIITKVADKTFVGKGILHAQVFKKGDERTIYNMIYKDGSSGVSYIKRFAVVGVTRDKEYDLTKGSKGSRVLYFTANPNGEAEIVTVQLKPHTKLKKLQFDLDFAEIAIKGRGSQGNIVSKYPIKKILFKSKGVSTLSGLKIWYDDLLRRLNVDGRGKYLGEFDGDDKILQVHKDGWYELSTFELSNHFDADLVLIQKFDPEKPFAVVQYEGKAKNYFIKRFLFEPIAVGKKFSLISEESGSKFLYITSNPAAVLTVDVLKGKTQVPETLEIVMAEFIDVKGIKANGNRLTAHDVKNITIANNKEIEPAEEVKASPVVASAEGGDDEPVDGEAMGVTADEGEEELIDPAMSKDADEEEVPLPETEEPAEEPQSDVSEDESVQETKAVKPKKVFESKPAKTPAAEAPVTEPEAAEPAQEEVPAAAKPAAAEEPKKAWGSPAVKPAKAEAAVKPEAKKPEPEAKPAPEVKPEPKKEEKPVKKVDFEITNPDDIKIDDKGQLGFF
ncbi:DNA topoisomerase IV subunit A [compost metagenome]